MRTEIHPKLIDNILVREADDILRKCVHCGFCTATCPTYQLLGDELDGPRGRIYLIKEMLETDSFSAKRRQHLDRCLTCRSCETTCPSGVEYGRLLDIGRDIAASKVSPSIRHRMLSFLIRTVIPRKWLFQPMVKLGAVFKPILPGFIARYLPDRTRVQAVKKHNGARVLLLGGCVQSAATPRVVASLQVLLEANGVKSELVDDGCCGALDYHLGEHEAGLMRMRRVIDLLYPRLEGIDYIASSASGCGVTIKEYPSALKNDPVYYDKAVAVSKRVVDAVELFDSLPFKSDATIAIQTPCTMQHGMKLDGRLEALFLTAGARLVDQKDGHLCCGSAGTYSILQPALSAKLRSNKLTNLQTGKPDVILTANVGCQLHLASEASVPVRHWLEYAADQLR